MLSSEEVLRSFFSAKKNTGTAVPEPGDLKGLYRPVLIGKVTEEARQALLQIRPYLEGPDTDIPARPARTIVKAGAAKGDRDLFWLILAGDFGVWPTQSSLDSPPIKVKHPGESFGEIVAFTEVARRTATVRLQDNCPWGLLLELDAAVVQREARAGRAPAIELLLNLMRSESERLEQMDGIVMGLEARIRAIETDLARRAGSRR